MKLLKRSLLFLSVLFIGCICALASNANVSPGNYFVNGIVRDSVTLEPLPYASVTIAGKAGGALTNERGIFEITVPNEAEAIHVTCLGYAKKNVPLRHGRVNTYDIELSPVATNLDELVVQRKKYSKKNNPAVDFAKALKEKERLTDPRRNPYYNYDKHQIISIALNDFSARDDNSWMFKKFPFLWEHVDTSEISGKPILNILVKEKASQVHYRQKPKSEKEIVTGLRQEGLDEIVDQSSILTYLEDLMQEINLYDNDLNILHNRFVSPLSRIAPDFYRFYLTDTVEVDSEKCVVLSFYPRNPSLLGFNGQVFVPLNDTTMFVKKVTLRTPRDINLNFIDNMFISQDFERAPDGSRIKTRDDITMELKVMPGTPGFYVRRNTAYANHTFEPPQDEGFFAKLGDIMTTADATQQDEGFWQIARIIPVSENEKRVSSMMTRLRKVPVFYWTETFLKFMFTGYIPTGHPSKFDYGPINTTFSHNYVEGWRIRAGGLTTANLSKRLFARGYIAYATRDRKWKYRIELEYSFHDKEYHSREFPIHSLRASSMYDIDMIGQKYLFTNADNIFLSLKRMRDTHVTYHYVHQLEYNLELRNNFSMSAAFKNEVQEATPHMPFVDGYGNIHRAYRETSLGVQLRYAPGEKFYQTKSHREPINLDAPIFILSQIVAPKGFLGSKYSIYTTEFSFQKRFWLSVLGYTDAIFKAGHVWSRAAFLNLLIPNANLSYTIQPESYALMNPMEFVNDTYASWDVTYWANGAIFNFIPVFKKFKLREVFAFRGLWGSLSDRNDPALHPELLRFPATAHVTKMTSRPYMEVSVGLDNILRCLRIDYVWRLTYNNVPYEIDRHGLRVAMHMTF